MFEQVWAGISCCSTRDNSESTPKYPLKLNMIWRASSSANEMWARCSALAMAIALIAGEVGGIDRDCDLGQAVWHRS